MHHGHSIRGEDCCGGVDWWLGLVLKEIAQSLNQPWLTDVYGLILMQFILIYYCFYWFFDGGFLMGIPIRCQSADPIVQRYLANPDMGSAELARVSKTMMTVLANFKSLK